MAVIRIPKRWELRGAAITSERAYLNRRQLVKGLGLAAAAPLLGGCYLTVERDPDTPPPPPPSGFLADLYPAPRNNLYQVLERGLSSQYAATHFNNFYEFTSSKGNVWRLVENLSIEPWTVEVTGLVQKPQVFDLEQLVRSMPLEERLYRFRCVEAWAMTVPWTGFSLARLLQRVQPLSSARFVRFWSLDRADAMPNRTLFPDLPWPYFEGLRLDEAMHELTLLATGIYGAPLPAQNGAPLRLIVPWKYGYKSIKSIVKIELVADQPSSFWSTVSPGEYDFVSNVNPEIPHPRWSQATEQLVESGLSVPTQPYNGYQELVASLYA